FGTRQRVAVAWHDAMAGLVAEDTAVMGGIANRRADVAAELERREARRQRRRAATRGAAGHAARVPGVAGGAVDRIEGLPVGERDRHVGLAEHDRARF